MKVFSNCLIILEFDASFQFKEKVEWRKKITDNGGIISYIVTKRASFLVSLTRKFLLSTFKVRQAERLDVPVVKPEFINACIDKQQLLALDAFSLGQTQKEKDFSNGKIGRTANLKHQRRRKFVNLSAVRSWYIDDPDLPVANDADFELAKWALLKADTTVQILEIHTLSAPDIGDCRNYRLFTQTGTLEKDKMLLPSSTPEVWYFPSSDEVVSGYDQLFCKMSTSPHNMEMCSIPDFVCQGVGSEKLQLLLLELSSLTASVSQDVASLVELVWREAVDEASTVLSMKIQHIKLEKLEAAEVALQQLLYAINTGEDQNKVSSILEDFYESLPHKKGQKKSELTLKEIASKQDLCQLVRDVLNVSEATDWSNNVTAVSKYRTLRCSIQQLDPSDDEFNMVESLMASTAEHVKVKSVYRISRTQENIHFQSGLGNVRLLMHSSRPANFLGILSRGLLLPDAVVKNFGVTRTDAGMLGCGIYFSDSASTSAKYSEPNTQTGTRLLLLCDVALGSCKEVTRTDTSLMAPPEGYHSVHGLKEQDKLSSQFKDDEFVIYDPMQQRVRYLVEFMLPRDTVTPLTGLSLTNKEKHMFDNKLTKTDVSDMKNMADPLLKVKSGLLGSRKQPLPLKSVHIRARMLDLVSQVVVLQSYKNDNNSPIEAKYVFPLDDTAAVCGFEAFINNKHIIGEVKEKTQAHREYKEAVKKGHGAYLMDEEEPDVFSVSVGNLPPKSDVLIKITYISELQVEGDSIRFHLPSCVAPWIKDTALAQQTQSTVDTVRIHSSKQCEVTVQVVMEMPFDIRKIESPTHPQIKYKQTATKAVVELPKNSQLNDGFELLVKLSEIHVPRMWVEDHSDTNSQACMLVFYPEFETVDDQDPEIIFLLDMSNSMKDGAAENAKKVVLLALENLPEKCFFNIVTFGTTFTEMFPTPQRKKKFTLDKATQFIQKIEPKSGCSNAWHPLQSLFLLSPSEGRRNILLVSDGHLSSVGMMLSATKNAASKNHLFCLGVGPAVNHHLMKSLAAAGGGHYEFYDSTSKYRWHEKLTSQLDKVKQPGLSRVNVDWEQHDSDGVPLVQAPSRIPCLFRGSRQVVYGFVPNCRQATLQADVEGKTFSTTVSTSDLNVTSGKILHQLTARAVIRDFQDGILADDKIQHQILKSARKQTIISLSKKYSIVTPFTSFVAIEERKQGEEAQKGPLLEELVAIETVDHLKYIGWQGLSCADENKNPRELVEECLTKAEIAEGFSILEAERQYEKLLDNVEELEKTDNGQLRNRVFSVLSSFCESTQSPKGRHILDVLHPSLKPTSPEIKKQVCHFEARKRSLVERPVVKRVGFRDGSHFGTDVNSFSPKPISQGDKEDAIVVESHVEYECLELMEAYDSTSSDESKDHFWPNPKTTNFSPNRSVPFVDVTNNAMKDVPGKLVDYEKQQDTTSSFFDPKTHAMLSTQRYYCSVVQDSDKFKVKTDGNVTAVSRLDDDTIPVIPVANKIDSLSMEKPMAAYSMTAPSQYRSIRARGRGGFQHHHIPPMRPNLCLTEMRRPEQHDTLQLESHIFKTTNEASEESKVHNFMTPRAMGMCRKQPIIGIELVEMNMNSAGMDTHPQTIGMGSAGMKNQQQQFTMGSAGMKNQQQQFTMGSAGMKNQQQQFTMGSAGMAIQPGRGDMGSAGLDIQPCGSSMGAGVDCSKLQQELSRKILTAQTEVMEEALDLVKLKDQSSKKVTKKDVPHLAPKITKHSLHQQYSAGDHSDLNLISQLSGAARELPCKTSILSKTSSKKKSRFSQREDSFWSPRSTSWKRTKNSSSPRKKNRSPVNISFRKAKRKRKSRSFSSCRSEKSSRRDRSTKRRSRDRSRNRRRSVSQSPNSKSSRSWSRSPRRSRGKIRSKSRDRSKNWKRSRSLNSRSSRSWSRSPRRSRGKIRSKSRDRGKNWKRSRSLNSRSSRSWSRSPRRSRGKIRSKSRDRSKNWKRSRSRSPKSRSSRSWSINPRRSRGKNRSKSRDRGKNWKRSRSLNSRRSRSWSPSEATREKKVSRNERPRSRSQNLKKLRSESPNLKLGNNRKEHALVGSVSRSYDQFDDGMYCNKNYPAGKEIMNENNWGVGRFSFLIGFSEQTEQLKEDNSVNIKTENKRAIPEKSIQNFSDTSSSDELVGERMCSGIRIGSSNDSSSNSSGSLICLDTKKGQPLSTIGLAPSEKTTGQSDIEIEKQFKIMDSSFWSDIVLGHPKLNQDNIEIILPIPSFGYFWEWNTELCKILDLSLDTEHQLDEKLISFDVATKDIFKCMIATALVLMSVIRLLFKAQHSTSYTTDLLKADLKLNCFKIQAYAHATSLQICLGYNILNVPYMFCGPIRWLKSMDERYQSQYVGLPFGGNRNDILCKMLQALSKY